MTKTEKIETLILNKVREYNPDITRETLYTKVEIGAVLVVEIIEEFMKSLYDFDIIDVTSINDTKQIDN